MQIKAVEAPLKCQYSAFFSLPFCHQVRCSFSGNAHSAVSRLLFRFQFKFINKIMIIYGWKWYAIWASRRQGEAEATVVYRFCYDKNQIMWNLYRHTIATIIWIMISQCDTFVARWQKNRRIENEAAKREPPHRVIDFCRGRRRNVTT